MGEQRRSQSIDDALREVARTRRIASALLHGAAAAEIDDVLQDASVAALASAAPRGADFAGWIRGAVHHLSMTVLRRRASRLYREREAARPVALPSTADVAHRLALQRVLLAEVEALAEPIRTAIVRRYLDGQPPRRIAKEQRVPLATVKTRLRRGLARLRERLNREWGEELGGALFVLSRGSGVGAAATTMAGASAVATGGAIAMSLKAKLLVATVALVVVAATSVRYMQRSSRASGGSPPDAVTSAAGRDAKKRDMTSEAMPLTVERVAAPTEEAASPSGSRRARLGAQRLAALTGRVVDEWGEAAAGVELEIVGRVTAGLPIAKIATDELPAGECHRAVSGPEGTFRFDDLVRGSPFDVAASASGGRRGVVRGVRAGCTDPVVVMLRPTTTIVGVVVDALDDRPVAGAKVKVRGGMTDGGHTFVATSDQDGRFEIAEVGGESAMLLATAPDGRCAAPLVVSLPESSTSEVRIFVGRAGAADGTVVDADTAAPIPHAAIMLEPWTDLVATRTDDAGAFRVRPGEWPPRGIARVVVVAPEYAQTRAELRVATEPSAPAPSLPSATIKLRRGRVAIGRLVTRDGAPVAGAALLVTRLGATSEEPGAILATTRDDGSFRFEAIDPTTRHVLLVRHFECEMIDVPFPSDELARLQINFGTVRVGRGAVVSGVVTDDVGAPIADAGVLLSPERGVQRGRATDARGRFEFADLSAGTTKLKATAPGSTRPGELTLDVKDEEIVETATLTIPAGLAIAGRVTDGTGAPVAGATLVLRRMGESGDATPDAVATVWSEADGRFRFSGLDPGAFRLEARPERSKEMRCASKEIERVDAGATGLQLVLPDGSFATGRVLDGMGQPVERVMLILSGSEGKAVAGGNSEADGTFKIPIPPDIELRLEARVFDPRHPGSYRDSRVVASLDHVRADGPPVTLVIANH